MTYLVAPPVCVAKIAFLFVDRAIWPPKQGKVHLNENNGELYSNFPCIKSRNVLHKAAHRPERKSGEVRIKLTVRRARSYFLSHSCRLLETTFRGKHGLVTLVEMDAKTARRN